MVLNRIETACKQKFEKKHLYKVTATKVRKTKSRNINTRIFHKSISLVNETNISIDILSVLKVAIGHHHLQQYNTV